MTDEKLYNLFKQVNLQNKFRHSDLRSKGLTDDDIFHLCSQYFLEPEKTFDNDKGNGTHEFITDNPRNIYSFTDKAANFIDQYDIAHKPINIAKKSLYVSIAAILISFFSLFF